MSYVPPEHKPLLQHARDPEALIVVTRRQRRQPVRDRIIIHLLVFFLVFGAVAWFTDLGPPHWLRHLPRLPYHHDHDVHVSMDSYITGQDVIPSQCFDKNTKDCREYRHSSDSTDFDIFEVTGPVDVQYGDSVGTVVLASHEFGHSYGTPYVTDYTPPAFEFSHVVLHLQGATYGRQFDRLSHIMLGGAEIWRPSTPEPGNKNISWTASKDVSVYAPLFREEQALAILLNNVVDKTYTGPVSYNLTAEFYLVENAEVSSLEELYESVRNEIVVPATQVIPLTTFEASDGHVYSSPDEQVRIPVPQLSHNTTKVVIDVIASGNAVDEFWYTNVLDSAERYVDNQIPGKGPARFVHVYVDNTLAGIANIFPIVYTGGISPGLWSPVVGIKAYDVPFYQVDLTPFLPWFWNKATTVSLKMFDGERDSDQTVVTNENWLLNANLLLWQSDLVQSSGYSRGPESTYTNKPSKVLLSRGPSLLQVIDSDQSVELSSSFSLVDHNDQTHDFDYTWSQKVRLDNVQSLNKTTFDQHVVHSLLSDDKVYVNDQEYAYQSGYPVLYRSTSTGEPNTTRFDLRRVYQHTSPRGLVVVSENATAQSTITDRGYEGGSAGTEVMHVQFVNGHRYGYQRHALAANSLVQYDHDGWFEVHNQADDSYTLGLSATQLASQLQAAVQSSPEVAVAEIQALLALAAVSGGGFPATASSNRADPAPAAEQDIMDVRSPTRTSRRS